MTVTGSNGLDRFLAGWRKSNFRKLQAEFADQEIAVVYHVAYAIERGGQYLIDDATATLRKRRGDADRLTAKDLGDIRAGVVKERGDGLVTANVIIINVIRLHPTEGAS